MAFQTGFHAKEVVEEEADHYRMLRAAMNRMAREIGSAYVSDRYDAQRYRDQNDRPTNFIGEEDQLHLTTFAHQRLYTDAKESDQAIVEYSVKTSSEREAHGRQDLMRRVNPNVEGRMDRGGTTDVLFEGSEEAGVRLLGLRAQGVGGRVGHAPHGAEGQAAHACSYHPGGARRERQGDALHHPDASDAQHGASQVLR